jgi:8-oxo-dGTP pyrophosphatase MutT (NUDIX family)
MKPLTPHAAFQTLSRKERPRIYGGILIYHNGQEDEYAIVQGRYTEKWSFPKGHSNDGETPMECTQREIQEETGISFLPTPTEYIRIGYGNYYIFPFEEKPDLRPRDTWEIINTKWATLEEMRELSLNVDVSKYVKIHGINKTEQR